MSGYKVIPLLKHYSNHTAQKNTQENRFLYTTSMCPLLIFSMWFISKVHFRSTFIHGPLHKKHGMPSL